VGSGALGGQNPVLENRDARAAIKNRGTVQFDPAPPSPGATLA